MPSSEPSSKSSQLNAEHTANIKESVTFESASVFANINTVIRCHGVHTIQKNHEVFQRALSGRLVFLWREYEPTDRNVDHKTQPDDDGRNNCEREAGMEVPVPIDTLQMEHFNHLENDAHE